MSSNTVETVKSGRAGKDGAARFGVEGMTCAGCVARVEGALRKVPGVDQARVNLAMARADVAFDPLPSGRGGIVPGLRGRIYARGVGWKRGSRG